MSSEPGTRTVGIIPVREADVLAAGRPILLAGRPLLAYTIEAAREASRLVRVVVSTDGDAAAKLARSLGADAPFVRPAELARPGVGIWQVLQHCVNWLQDQQGDRFDTVVLLEASHPVRPRGLVDRVIDALTSSDFDSVLTAHEERHAFWMQTPDGEIHPVALDHESSRQTRPPLFREVAGLACASRQGVVAAGRGPGRNVGIVPVRSWFGLIDTQDPFGLLVAEKLIEAAREQPELSGGPLVGFPDLGPAQTQNRR